jgi:hypothetical protein
VICQTCARDHWSESKFRVRSGSIDSNLAKACKLRTVVPDRIRIRLPRESLHLITHDLRLAAQNHRHLCCVAVSLHTIC